MNFRILLYSLFSNKNTIKKIKGVHDMNQLVLGQTDNLWESICIITTLGSAKKHLIKDAKTL